MTIAPTAPRVNFPGASRLALGAQLRIKLRRPFLEFPMVLDILDNHIPNRSVSSTVRAKYPSFHNSPPPKPLLEPCQ